ncbi:ligase-associated DNA damage response endonuclease PdeM [Roseiconus nitratireducens]|uniref:Ligase-associated DNA damage response endonuclease PdeM n=1 Tax=Roseiconus nitratireducens TaxID=2605748 RepID=A0A5M6D3V7_9BACT|nr:ligase-associated DNA damage response endonuclease PdeM [Roseiconus nitratireducens]KAA5542197.1 ligase-associated DNA damage response endonuclease PdeM [Roseiconus nitratireducens]
MDDASIAPMDSARDVTLRGVALQLLAGGGVFWKARRTLFVADLHLGKDATFRKRGFAVPRGPTESTLGRITTLIEQTAAETLVVLGDMVHARCSVDAALHEAMTGFRAAHADIELILVRGNHDASIRSWPQSWRMRVVEEGFRRGPLRLQHHPGEPPPPARLALAGHVHPSVRLQSGNDSLGRMPCFWYSGGCLTLPAMGAFTGTHVIRPRPRERVWVVAQQQLLEFQHG